MFATLSDDRSPAGLTGFVVHHDASGFHVSEILPTMGLRACPLVEFYLENVTVPAAHLLTAEGEAHALVHALSARDRYQGAAIAVGIARGAFELARQHSIVRIQGGGPIAAIKWCSICSLIWRHRLKPHVSSPTRLP